MFFQFILMLVIAGIPAALQAVDTDGDGVIDATDVFPYNPNEQLDSDNDGIGDNADIRAGEGFYNIGTLVKLEGGTFMMGIQSPPDSLSQSSTYREVTLSPYYIADTETSGFNWDGTLRWAINNGYTDLGRFEVGWPVAIVGQSIAWNHPATTIGWFDAVKWCNAASERNGLKPVYLNSDGSVFRSGFPEQGPVIDYGANGFRLPTEAEWEFAARGGSHSNTYPWGNYISATNANYGWSPFSGNQQFSSWWTGDQDLNTAPTKEYSPNGYGHYQMAGNVNEWCNDPYSNLSSTPSKNPTGPEFGSYLVVRGGSWQTAYWYLRNYQRYRNSIGEQARWYDHGFRVVRSPDTDGDGVSDMVDYFPIDFTKSEAPDTPAPINPPEITSSPTSQTLNSGQMAVFSVTASGSNLSYQWNKNGVAISGANAASLTIGSLDETDSGDYTVVVTNPAGSATSNPASLYVEPEDDHGNELAAATAVDLNSSTRGRIEVGGDADYFVVTVASSGTLTVTTSGDTDTIGYLLSSGASTLSDDDDGVSYNFQIVNSVRSGIYYIKVQGFDRDTTTGSYDLIVTFEPDPLNAPPEITSVASFTVSAGDSHIGTIVATDVDDDDITYSIVGGDDAALFNIDSSSGALSLITASSGRATDAVYALTVAATDGDARAEQAITVIVEVELVWQPQGWVYYAWPYAYSISEQRWHFFDTSNTQWRVNLLDGQWGVLAETTGWNFYAWPYSYSTDQNTWHWYDQNTQWVVDLVSGIWSRLGASAD